MADTSPSALVVRLDGIGDALALTPLVAALRDRGVRVSAVLQAGNAQALAARAFERVHVATFSLRDRSGSNRRALADFARNDIQPHGYDYALVATEDFSGYALARAARVPKRIGFDNGWGKPFKTLAVRSLCTHTVRRSAGLDPRAPHECAVLFELGRPLFGSDAAPTKDLGALRPLILDGDPRYDGRTAVQITDKWMRLGAGFDDLADLVRALATRGPIRLFGSAAERPFVEAVAASVGMPVEIFDALPAWKDAIAGAAVLVAPDSGALHVAGMIGTPVVGCFPVANFALQALRWAPWAAPNELFAMHGDWMAGAVNASVRLSRANTTAKP